MKKTLIALAVVAVSGAAFAQSSVTLSGKFGTSFQKTVGGDAGLAVTDGDVRFTAVEDLGGGLKANVSMEVAVRGRVAAAPNSYRNSTVGLSGGFGSVTMGAVEAGNGIQGRGHAGAPVSLADGYDGSVLSGTANVDWLMYQSPALIPGLTANYQRVDSIGNPGNTKTISGNVIGLNYAAGPLSAGIDYTNFSTARTVGTAGLYAVGVDQGKSRVRASASYNLGVAALGFGVEKNSALKPQYALGVTVPMGAISLGAIYDKNQENGASGWGVGTTYALSKRTNVNASYGKIKNGSPAVLTGATNGSQYRVRLMHSF